jgi:hypothetical protein
MAYSKAEYENSKIPDYKRIERDIDAKLMAFGVATIHVKTLQNVDTNKAYDFIKNTYEKVGWKVQRITGYDQRDGDSWDYISIS